MKKQGWSASGFAWLIGVLYFWSASLLADLDMYVYNVGQANCILVTIDDKDAIFFDTGYCIEMLGTQALSHITKVVCEGKCNNVYFVLSHTDDDHVNLFKDIFTSVHNTSVHNKCKSIVIGVCKNDNLDELLTEKLKLREPQNNYTQNILNNTRICALKGKKCAIATTSSSNGKGRKGNIILNNFGEFQNNKIPSIPNCKILLPDKMKKKKMEKKNEKDLTEDYEPDNANEASVVVKLTYNGKSILFPGDAPGKLFKSICGNPIYKKRSYAKHPLKDIDILIWPHHGSMSSNSYRWYGELKHLNMFCSIISSDPNGPSHIPERSVMEYTPLTTPHHFDLHDISYFSHLEAKIHNRNTMAPIFITANAELGYHVKIDGNNDMGISITEMQMNNNDVIEKIIKCNKMTDSNNNIINVMNGIMNVDQSPLVQNEKKAGQTKKKADTKSTRKGQGSRSGSGTRQRHPLGRFH
jgi:beta-lactamase superfamily II metal-dependent hydrolase